MARSPGLLHRDMICRGANFRFNFSFNSVHSVFSIVGTEYLRIEVRESNRDTAIMLQCREMDDV